MYDVMNRFYFSINIIKKEINVFTVLSDQLDAGRNLFSKFSFDDVITMSNGYVSDNCHSEIKELLSLMMQYIDRGKKLNIQISELNDFLEKKYAQNTLVLIFLSILKRKYQYEKDYLHRMNIVNCLLDGISQRITNDCKRKVTDKYNELTRSMSTLVDFCKNDFQHNIPEHILIQYKYGAIDINKREVSQLYSFDDSLDTFIYLFLSQIYIGNLKVFTCENCHKKYFSEINTRYCSDTECQKVKEKEIRKKDRINRRKNPYKSLSDTFNTYVRQKKHNLKQKGVSASTLSIFETEKSTCLYNVKMEISTYQDCERPIDDDLISYIEEQKGHIKALYDSLSKQKGTD